MSSQDHISSLINKYGTSITILRNAGNISDKCRLVPNKFASKPFLLEYQKDGYFTWDSQIIDGDIFKDNLTEEYYIVVNCNFFGKDLKDGKKALVYRSNNKIILYALSEAVENQYGQKVYNWMVKLNDYANISYYVKGDKLTAIGDVSFDQLFIIFSGRNLQGYVPKTSDRIVLLNGTKLQIDGIDPYLYAGCYEVICSLDQRL